MKYIILLSVVSLSLSAPQIGRQDTQLETQYRSNPEDVNAEILKSHQTFGPEHGQFEFGFQSSNQIEEERQGELLQDGGQQKTGYFIIPLDDGQHARFEYTAGLGGYDVKSDFLHPMPAHAIEQIRMAEELRAQGVEWDDRGFRI